MKSRERLLTTLRHKEPDRVPIDFGSTSTGIEVEAYDRLKSMLGYVGKTNTFVRDHAEINESILERFHVDTRYIRIKPPGGYKPQIDLDNSYVDFWGIRWKKPPSSHYWDMVDHPIKEPTMEALRKYRWPDPDDRTRIRGLRERAKALHEKTEYAIVADVIGSGVFGQAWNLRGMMNFLMDLVLHQTFAEALMQQIADFQISLWKNILAEVGEYIQVAMVADDLGVQNAPMLSPETYRKLIKPAQKRVWQAIKSNTDAFLFLHSCGSVRAFIPDFIELGVDILNPIQLSAKGMDAKELKTEFGRDLTFWGGGCDTQQVLINGTPEDVEKEVKRRIQELAPGGGFVFNQVHNIQPYVPAENIVKMFDTAIAFGAYPVQA